MRVDVPVGKVRFYDADKGFGFLTKDEGGDVYVRSTALPDGVTTLKAGQKVEFGVVEGRRGEQALSLRVLEAPPSLSKAQRKPADQIVKSLAGIRCSQIRGCQVWADNHDLSDVHTASGSGEALRAQ